MAGRYRSKAVDEAETRIADALKHSKSVYVECRGMRHAWEVLNDFHMLENHGSGPRFLRQDLECMRGCGVVRHDTFLVRFVAGEPRISEKLHSGYTYPEDYQIPGIPRGVKRFTIYHQERFRRAMEKVAGAAPGESDRAEA